MIFLNSERKNNQVEITELNVFLCHFIFVGSSSFFTRGEDLKKKRGRSLFFDEETKHKQIYIKIS